MDILYYLFCLCLFASCVCSFKLDGRIILPSGGKLSETQLVIDDGNYKGFLRADGSFSVYNIPTGSFVVEVVNPTYAFESIRVDVSSKGSVRARKLNHIKPSAVALLKYPLEMKPVGITKYFARREQFSIFDMLKSPMVLMMVIPMLFMFVLPKMMNMNDPETRREMESSMNMFNQNSSQVPDMAEWLSNAFGSKKKSTKAITSSGKSGKSSKRRKNE